MGRLKARQRPPERRRPGPWDPLLKTGLFPVDFLYDMPYHAPLNLVGFLSDMAQMRFVGRGVFLGTSRRGGGEREDVRFDFLCH